MSQCRFNITRTTIPPTTRVIIPPQYHSTTLFTIALCPQIKRQQQDQLTKIRQNPIKMQEIIKEVRRTLLLFCYAYTFVLLLCCGV